MSTSFTDLGVPAEMAAALAARGITEPFPIQALTIPAALAGRDVCGRAPTGSGKTLAFGVPLAQRVTRGGPRKPSALVLAPTRELAAQIHDELKLLLGRRGNRVASFYGGVGFGQQLKALRRGIDVAVGCPGRIADLVRRGDLVLDQVAFVVVDEADRMADMGFLPEVRRLLDLVRPDRQTLLFSATLDGDVDVLISRYQHDPVRCEVPDEDDAGERTSHHFLDTDRAGRVAKTAELIADHGPTVVFCRTKHGADRVAVQLQQAGISAVAIHGGRSQSQRDRALASFASGRSKALVATDVMARGIHVDDVGCVVHFDIAGDHKDYVHRSGRTGRAGAVGVVVSLVTETDVVKVRQLQRALGMPLHPVKEDRSRPAERRPGRQPRRANTTPSAKARPRGSKARSARAKRQG